MRVENFCVKVISYFVQMIIGPIVELELPKHNDVLPEEYFNENCIFFYIFVYLQ